MARLLYQLLTGMALAAIAGAAASSDAGTQGQAQGRQIIDNRPPTTYNGEPAAAELELQIGGVSVDLHDLVPGAQDQSLQRLEELGQADQVETLEAAAAHHREGLATEDSPWAEAQRAGTTGKRHRIDPDADFLATTRQLMQPGSIDDLASSFTDCTVETTIQSPDLSRPGAAEANVFAAFIDHQRACQTLRERPDRVRRQREVEVTAEKGLALVTRDGSATEDLIESHILDHYVPNASEGYLLDHVEVTWYGDVQDVRLLNFPSPNDGYLAEIEVVFDPDGPDEQRYQFEILGDVYRVSETIESQPDPLLEDGDGFCRATWQCTAAGGRTIDGVFVDTRTFPQLGDLYPADPRHQPPSSLAPICWEAEATYDCDYHLGDMGCWTTPTGERVCHENTEGNTVDNTCEAVIEAERALGRACQVLDQKCQGNAQSTFDGFCYVHSYTLGCAERQLVPEVHAERALSCEGGALGCVGESCFEPYERERPGTDFARAAAALTLIQHLTSDVEIETTIKTTAFEPVLMPGRPHECRKSTGGTLDCCVETTADANRRYMRAYAHHNRHAQAKVAVELADGDGASAGELLSDPRNYLAASLSRPLTSVAESYRGGGERVPATDSRVTDPTLGAVMDRFREEAFADFVVSGQAYQCNDQELDLALQREAGACLYAGSYCDNGGGSGCLVTKDVYCCYNSALSRQVHESLAPRLAPTKKQLAGGAANLCPGLPASTVSAYTLAQVGMSDWIGRLARSGAIPSVEDVAQRLSVETLTGSGSVLATDGARDNVVERSRKRLAAIDVPAARDGIATNVALRDPGPVQERPDQQYVYFSPGYYTGEPGTIVSLRVERVGTDGSVSVQFATQEGSARPGADYEATSGTLSWSDGEGGAKTVPVRLPPQATVNTAFAVTLSAPTLSFPRNRTADVIIRAGDGQTLPPTTHDQTLALRMAGSDPIPVDDGVQFDVWIEIENLGIWDFAAPVSYEFSVPDGFSVVSVADISGRAMCEAHLQTLDLGESRHVFCSSYEPRFVAPGDTVRVVGATVQSDLASPSTASIRCHPTPHHWGNLVIENACQLGVPVESP